MGSTTGHAFGAPAGWWRSILHHTSLSMTVATRSQHLYLAKINERHVLRLIRDLGPLSRADVVRRSGLSALTVSKAAASLQKAGLLEEIEGNGQVIGRPAMKLRLATTSAQVLGIVIDSNRSWVVATGLDGELRDERTRRVETRGSYEDLIGTLARHARAHGASRCRTWASASRFRG